MVRKLLFSVTRKDLEVTFYSGHGPGGQNRNKVQNCVRIRHPASGALVTGQERRERQANVKAALERLVKHPKFRAWWSRRVAELESGRSAEQVADEAMVEGNLRVEVLKGKRWVPWE